MLHGKIQKKKKSKKFVDSEKILIIHHLSIFIKKEIKNFLKYRFFLIFSN